MSICFTKIRVKRKARRKGKKKMMIHKNNKLMESMKISKNKKSIKIMSKCKIHQRIRKAIKVQKRNNQWIRMNWERKLYQKKTKAIKVKVKI